MSLDWKVSTNGVTIYAPSVAANRAVYGIDRENDGRYCVSAIGKLLDVQPLPFAKQDQAIEWCNSRELQLLAKNSNPVTDGKDSTMAATGTEQAVMFPELDNSPEHKALMRAVKNFVKKKANRDEVLGVQKQEVDKAMEDVIVKMKAANINKFHHESFNVEIIAGKEKVKVKIDTDEDESDEGGDEE